MDLLKNNLFLYSQTFLQTENRLSNMTEKQPRKLRNTSKRKAASPPKKEGNVFDKIIRENIEKIFRPLVEKRLGIKIVKATYLKEKMHTTVELEMDFFYEIETETGEVFILHLEFESGDNHGMIYRVGEYHGMAQIRFKLPIRHVVIYLGDKKPTMRTELKPEEVFTGFDLIDLHSLNPDELLSSQIPEVVLTAVLADFKPEEAELILRKIVENLKKLVKNKRVLKKYINQLVMLSRLRKIESLTIKITEDMPIHYDIETDSLYLKGTQIGREQGIEQGIEQGKKEQAYLFVRNLILNSDVVHYSDEQIARLADVTIEFVQQVRLELAQKK